MIIINGKGYSSKEVRFLDEISRRILYEISESPKTISEISRSIGKSPQLVNYYINSKIKDFVEKIKDGNKIKYKAYKLYYEIINNREDFIVLNSLKRNLYPFIINGIFDGYIIVGSPDPHGPFSARARDLHYVGYLTTYLGKYIEGIKNENYIRIDTDVINTDMIKNNLIVIGGPVTNMITYRVNTSLKVRFLQEYNWDIYSEFSNKRYYEETIGLIANIRNPFNQEKRILLFAGKRAIGTKISVKYFIKNNINLDKEFYIIVGGLDEDGDGIIDKEYIVEENYIF